MPLKNLSGTAEISDVGIKKHFVSAELWQPLFELVWNGLDARAHQVSVHIEDTELGGTDVVTVLDNGDGINIDNISDNFGRFNDSNKKGDAGLHGSHGRGRLAFHIVAERATWWTKVGDKDAVIQIFAKNIKHFEGELIGGVNQHHALAGYKSGTYVELTNFHKNLPKVSTLQEKFSVEFGWYLALHKDRRISLNGEEVKVPKHDLTEKQATAGGVEFDIKVIRWDDRPTSEKSYIYLLDSKGTIRHKQLSSFNFKSNFYVSVYVQSPWADNFRESGKDLLSPNSVSADSEPWKELENPLREIVDAIHDDFLRLYVEEEIQKYEDTGVFPVYPGMPAPYVAWRETNARNLVRAVYMSDPTLMGSLNKKQKKVMVRLFDRLSVSNENDALFEIIKEVLELDDKNLKTLAQQLQHTRLEHIISTIELLRRRQLAVDQLRLLMNDHYREVLETPDLQQIIENNTWLFGNQYETIGAEEDTFSSVARNLRAQLKNANKIDEDDVEEETDIPGVQRQTDLFLYRQLPALDSRNQQYFRCIIIEIKRPGIALNKKHLRQLEDYADIIKKHPAFASEHMHFELVLVGRKISSADTEIKSRLDNQLHRGELGLVAEDKQMKRYVLNWYTLLDGIELTYGHLLKTLELQRNALDGAEKDELVADLQKTA